jgi:hypothetical protein
MRLRCILVGFAIFAAAGCGGGDETYTLQASRDCLGEHGVLATSSTTSPKPRRAASDSRSTKMEVMVAFGRDASEADRIAETYAGFGLNQRSAGNSEANAMKDAAVR